MEKKRWNNGYSDGSGKGTITFDDKGKLRPHWGCSCCDIPCPEEDKKIQKLTNKIVKILNDAKAVI